MLFDHCDDLPDLVKYSRLSTTFEHDGRQTSIVHTWLMDQWVRRREVWVHERYLAQGGSGIIISLQRKHQGMGSSSQDEFRAVKNIVHIPQQDRESNLKLYKRELEALAKFSQEKVGGFFIPKVAG